MSSKTISTDPGANENAQKKSPSRASLKRGYKVSEAAEYLGISPISIRRAIQRGLLKPSRVFRHPIIPQSQLDELLNRGVS